MTNFLTAQSKDDNGAITLIDKAPPELDKLQVFQKRGLAVKSTTNKAITFSVAFDKGEIETKLRDLFPNVFEHIDNQSDTYSESADSTNSDIEPDRDNSSWVLLFQLKHKLHIYESGPVDGSALEEHMTSKGRSWQQKKLFFGTLLRYLCDSDS